MVKVRTFGTLDIYILTASLDWTWLETYKNSCHQFSRQLLVILLKPSNQTGPEPQVGGKAKMMTRLPRMRGKVRNQRPKTNFEKLS